VARQNNEDSNDQAKIQFDAKAAPHKFLPNQLVVLDEHSFLGKNQKLATKWSGPHKIIRLKGDSNLEIQLKYNNRKTVVHSNQLKPYFVATKNSTTFPDVTMEKVTAPNPSPDQLENQNFSTPEPPFSLLTQRSQQLILPLQL
jgi:hypothetical protein